MAFIMAIIVGIFSAIIQQMTKAIEDGIKFKTIGITISILVLFGLFIYIMLSSEKGLNKYKPRDVMLNISLKVLEDLEKEIN
jgi:type III secretory pathway component EscS